MSGHNAARAVVEEPDFFVTRQEESTKLYLRRTPEGTPTWTIMVKRALRFAHEGDAAAAAADINKDSATTAVVERE